MPKNYCIMQIWAEFGKSALPICNYSQILYQFLTFTQNLKRSQVIGFTLSTFCFFFFESFYLDRKKPLWLTIVLSIGATVIMYVVFGMFFKVSFPDKFMNMIRGI